MRKLFLLTQDMWSHIFWACYPARSLPAFFQRMVYTFYGACTWHVLACPPVCPQHSLHTPAQLRAGPAMAHKGGMCRITGHGKTSTQNSGVQERPLMAVPCRIHRISSDIQIGAAHGSGSTRVGVGPPGKSSGCFQYFSVSFFIISQQTDKHRLGELAFFIYWNEVILYCHTYECVGGVE